MMQSAALMDLLHPAYTIFRSKHPVGELSEVAVNVMLRASQVNLPAVALQQTRRPKHYSSTQGAR
jgi:hypothetical protein